MAARDLTRRHARTFYFASHVLPPQKRADAYSVYAFCRYADDQVDFESDEARQDIALVRLHDLLDVAYGKEPWRENNRFPDWLEAFREVAERRSIPRSYFTDLLLGLKMDRGAVRLQTWPELERYCYHVASVVGLIMVHVLAEPSPDLLEPARDLGTAMQLTNILRDVGEDWDRNRIYLPAKELAAFGLDDQDIAQHRVTPDFRRLMIFQITRARSYYHQAEAGIRKLPADGSRRSARLMSTLYGAILDEIEKADFEVFTRRVKVSGWRKVQLAVKSWNL